MKQVVMTRRHFTLIVNVALLLFLIMLLKGIKNFLLLLGGGNKSNRGIFYIIVDEGFNDNSI